MNGSPRSPFRLQLLRAGLLLVVASSSGCGGETTAVPDQFLFVWAADLEADANGGQSDFLAVLDGEPASSNYGDVLATVPVGSATVAHHSEHRMSASDRLFVNGFQTGRSFVIDLSDPFEPAVAARFEAVEGFNSPHSFERLPNGNVLATFQNAAAGEGTTGGLVELNESGELVRSASAAVSQWPEIRPYSLAVLAERDRVVSTSASMRDNPMVDDPSHLARVVQIWRLSDLELLHTLELPPGPRGDEQFAPAEPRLLADGSVGIGTFRCGLYRLTGVELEQPRVEHLHTFAFRHPEGDHRHCALPVVIGPWWVQTVPAREALVAVDLRDPTKAVEASSLAIGEGAWPHWISADAAGSRIVLTGYATLQRSVTLVSFDQSNGRLEIDRRFGDGGAVDFGRAGWPHGESGAASPHGVVFSLPSKR